VTKSETMSLGPPQVEYWSHCALQLQLFRNRPISSYLFPHWQYVDLSSPENQNPISK